MCRAPLPHPHTCPAFALPYHASPRGALEAHSVHRATSCHGGGHTKVTQQRSLVNAPVDMARNHSGDTRGRVYQAKSCNIEHPRGLTSDITHCRFHRRSRVDRGVNIYDGARIRIERYYRSSRQRRTYYTELRLKKMN